MWQSHSCWCIDYHNFPQSKNGTSCSLRLTSNSTKGERDNKKGTSGVRDQVTAESQLHSSASPGYWVRGEWLMINEVSCILPSPTSTLSAQLPDPGKHPTSPHWLCPSRRTTSCHSIPLPPTVDDKHLPRHCCHAATSTMMTIPLLQQSDLHPNHLGHHMLCHCLGNWLTSRWRQVPN